MYGICKYVCMMRVCCLFAFLQLVRRIAAAKIGVAKQYGLFSHCCLYVKHTHAHTHSHSLTHSLTHSFTHSLTHSQLLMPQIYTEDLAMMIRGYMTPMRQRVGELFDDETIAVIFSNIEQLHRFHVTFCKTLDEMGQERE